MSGWSRRRFLEGVFAGVAASALARWPDAGTPAGSGGFLTGEAARRVGVACRRALGGRPGAAAAVLASIDSAEELARLVREDFARERIVIVEGIVLARTEAVVFAAHAEGDA